MFIARQVCTCPGNQLFRFQLEHDICSMSQATPIYLGPLGRISIAACDGSCISYLKRWQKNLMIQTMTYGDHPIKCRQRYRILSNQGSSKDGASSLKRSPKSQMLKHSHTHIEHFSQMWALFEHSYLIGNISYQVRIKTQALRCRSVTGLQKNRRTY